MAREEDRVVDSAPQGIYGVLGAGVGVMHGLKINFDKRENI